MTSDFLSGNYNKEVKKPGRIFFPLKFVKKTGNRLKKYREKATGGYPILCFKPADDGDVVINEKQARYLPLDDRNYLHVGLGEFVTFVGNQNEIELWNAKDFERYTETHEKEISRAHTGSVVKTD